MLQSIDDLQKGGFPTINLAAELPDYILTNALPEIIKWFKSRTETKEPAPDSDSDSDEEKMREIRLQDLREANVE